MEAAEFYELSTKCALSNEFLANSIQHWLNTTNALSADVDHARQSHRRY
jgi:hypothetical protein